jgi:hypothetical protein
LEFSIYQRGAQRYLDKNTILTLNRVPGSDVVFVQLNHEYVKDFTNLFIKEEDMQRTFEFVYVGWSSFEQPELIISSHQITNVKEHRNPINLTHSVAGDLRVQRPFVGVGQPMPGVCGSYWITFDTRSPRKIMGIHSGNYNSTESYCSPITQEMIEKYCPKGAQAEAAFFSIDGLHDPQDEEDSAYLERAYDPRMLDTIPPGCRVVGVMRKSHHKTFYANSDLRASKLQQFRDPKGAPARVRGSFVNGEYVRATMNTEIKMRRNFRERDPAPYFPLVEIIMDRWQPFPVDSYDPSDAAVLNGQTSVVNGQELTMTPFFLNTSGGHGYVHIRSKEGKRDYIARVELEDQTLGEIVLTPHYAERLSLEQSIMEANLNQLWISHANLKVEVLEIYKVLEGKVRVFYASGMNTVHHTKKYFGRFMMMIRNQHPIGPNMVGMNPFGRDTHAMFRHMRSVAPSVNWFDGDFKGYDLAIPRWVWSLVMFIVFKWYKENPEEDFSKWQRARESLANQFYMQLVVWGCYLISRAGGTLSGLFGTAEFNGLATEVMSLITFYELARDNTDWTFTQICEAWKHKVAIVVYGDDNLFAVSSEIPWFNRVSFGNKSKEIFGMDYTAADKTAEMSPYSPWDEVSFLKRKFYCYDGDDPSTSTIMGVMSEEDILERIFWFRKSAHYTEEEGVRQNVESALRDFALYGEETYNKWRDTLNRWLRGVGFASVPLTFKEASGNFFPEYVPN